MYMVHFLRFEWSEIFFILFRQLQELVVRCLIELDGRGHLKLYLSSLEEEICMNVEVVGHPALTTPLKNFPKKVKKTDI